MNKVYRYQRRKKLSTSEAVATFLAGRSRPCPVLQVIETHMMPSRPIRQPDNNTDFETSLLDYKHWILGSVEKRSCVECSDGLKFIPTKTSKELSEFCITTFSTAITCVKNNDFRLVRKFAVMLEEATFIDDAFCLMEIMHYILFLSRHDFSDIAQRLMLQFYGTAKSNTKAFNPIRGIVMRVCRFDLQHLQRAYLSHISIIVDIQRSLRPQDFKFCFRARLLSSYMRLRFASFTDHDECNDLLHQSIETFGLASMSTLAVLDMHLRLGNLSLIQQHLAHLTNPLYFVVNTHNNELLFKDNILCQRVVIELAMLCHKVEMYQTEKNLYEYLLHLSDYTSSLAEEYQVLAQLNRLSTRSPIADGNMQWRNRMEAIEEIWQAEIDAACLEVRELPEPVEILTASG